MCIRDSLLTGCAASRKAHVSATPDGKQYVVILSMDAFRYAGYMADGCTGNSGSRTSALQ